MRGWLSAEIRDPEISSHEQPYMVCSSFCTQRGLFVCDPDDVRCTSGSRIPTSYGPPSFYIYSSSELTLASLEPRGSVVGAEARLAVRGSGFRDFGAGQLACSCVPLALMQP